jgi:hypothetical protein
VAGGAAAACTCFDRQLYREVASYHLLVAGSICFRSR